ncbi:HNH endonuclease [Brachybacterium nesterenkovii]|uniref:HNH endonuclease n=1 Tax=Brachybacterium nesterenkovii TaxID=47847 RepID=UPI00321A35EC
MTDRIYALAREVVWERDNGWCVLCGRTAESVHHRQGRGGKTPHRLSNLISVCGDGVRGCHGRIHANPSAAYAHGWMVPRNGIRSTTDTPIKTTRGWTLLADDGSYITTEAPA